MASSQNKRQSVSQQQRQQGNLYFKSAQCNFGFVIRCGRLEAALQCYTNAFSSSLNDDDAVSAAKNVAMTTWKLASLNAAARDRDLKVQKIIAKRNFSQALQYFNIAYQRRACKSAAWADHLGISMEQCGMEAMEWVDTYIEDVQERDSLLSGAITCLPDGNVKAEEYVKLATSLFGQGVAALGNRKYRDCFRFMKECYFPIQEAGRMGGRNTEITSNVKVITEDVYLHTCIAEAGKARSTGDHLLETGSGLKKNGDLNVDLAWEIVDWFRQSATSCKGNDIEQEAIAYSRLGHVYGKVLHMAVRAKNYYKQAIELAISMAPRSFHNVEWFEESKKFVEDFQKRLNKDGEKNKEKEEVMGQMKADLDKLKGFEALTSIEYVKTLYETWPPKAPKAAYDATQTKKKLLIKAISHYHPDKCSKEVHGKKWYYFTEEITKALNKRYEQEKFLDVD